MCGVSLQCHVIVWDEVLAMCAVIQLRERAAAAPAMQQAALLDVGAML